MNKTIENLGNKIVYDTFVTLSPDPRNHKGIHRPRDQFLHYDWILSKLTQATDYMLVPELSKQGNIHYHAMVVIRDPIKWYTTVVPAFKRIGFLLIKPITGNYKKVLEYCFKDVEQNKKIFKIKTLPIMGTYKKPLKLGINVLNTALVSNLIKSDCCLDKTVS